MRNLALAVALTVAACGGGGGTSGPKPLRVPDNPKPDYRPADPVDDARGARIAPGAETIELITDDGVVIQATAWSGTGESAGTQAIVLAHQLSSNRYEWEPLLKDLVNDYAVVTIDLRGHGGSIRKTDGSAVGWRKFTDADWARIVLDVKAAVAYVRSRGATSVGLLGGSIGSSAVMLYGASDPAINAVALVSPGLSYHGLDTKEAVRAYGGRPLLLLSTKGDERSAEAVRELGAIDANAEQHIYDGTRHGISIRRDEPAMLEDIVGFFDAALD